jgi:hypothetical protein
VFLDQTKCAQNGQNTGGRPLSPRAPQAIWGLKIGFWRRGILHQRPHFHLFFFSHCEGQTKPPALVVTARGSRRFVFGCSQAVRKFRCPRDPVLVIFGIGSHPRLGLCRAHRNALNQERGMGCAIPVLDWQSLMFSLMRAGLVLKMARPYNFLIANTAGLL